MMSDHLWIAEGDIESMPQSCTVEQSFTTLVIQGPGTMLIAHNKTLRFYLVSYLLNKIILANCSRFLSWH